MLDTCLHLLPQSVLAVAACLFFLGGTIRVPRHVWGPLTVIVLLLAGLLIPGFLLNYPADAKATGILPYLVPVYSAVTSDVLSAGVQLLCVVLGSLFVLASLKSQQESPTAAEFYGLLLLLLSGVMLVAAANDLILMFLALELISIPTYVLLFIDRRGYSSQEATTKYFLLSVLSAVILLYGMSFLYGLTGTTNLAAMQGVQHATYGMEMRDGSMLAPRPSALGLVAVVMVFAGLGFKMTAVPFHFYAPDVYQGTTPFNAGLLAVVPKVAGFVALIRLLPTAFYGLEIPGEHLALILAAITMTAGNCLALLQTNIRRILAYSSVAHAGYMLIGVAVGFWSSVPGQSLQSTAGVPNGVQSCLLYLVTYALANVGLFSLLIYLPREGKQIEHIDELIGLGRTQFPVALVAALCLLSLTGIPPLPGFWGKLAIFTSALSAAWQTGGSTWSHGFTLVAVLGMINAAIGAVYYLRIVAIMFLNDPVTRHEPSGGRGARIATYAVGCLLMAVGLQPRPLFHYLNQIDPKGYLSSEPVEPQATVQPLVQTVPPAPLHDGVARVK